MSPLFDGFDGNGDVWEILVKDVRDSLSLFEVLLSGRLLSYVAIIACCEFDAEVVILLDLEPCGVDEVAEFLESEERWERRGGSVVVHHCLGHLHDGVTDGEMTFELRCTVTFVIFGVVDRDGWEQPIGIAEIMEGGECLTSLAIHGGCDLMGVYCFFYVGHNVESSKLWLGTCHVLFYIILFKPDFALVPVREGRKN